MLTNEIRKQYQMKPTQSGWKEIELKNGYGSKVLIDKNNVLQKFIMDNSDKNKISYQEIDYNIQLTEDLKILTKTGKTKGLSYSVLEQMKPANKHFSVYFDSIDLYNFDNNTNVLFDYNLSLQSKDEVIAYIENRIKNRSDFEKEEFKKFTAAKKANRQKIKSGDIFRVKLCNHHFAYGRVLFDLKKFYTYEPAFVSKLNVGFRNSLIFKNPLFYPVLVDFFLIRANTPYLTANDLTQYKSTPSLILNSELVKGNTFQIIGNRELVLSSFDIPMSWETYYQYKPISHIFKWGEGIKTFPPVKRLEKLTELTYPINYKPLHLKTIEGLDVFLKTCLAGKPDFKSINLYGDLRESLFKEIRKIISKNIGFDIDSRDYDSFAKQFGFMTKQEILNFTTT